MPLEDAGNAISAAFTAWTRASCPTSGGGRSRVSIDVRDLGPVDCGKVEYNQSGGNQNVIVFRDDAWPHHDANSTLALTTITFNPETGEIYDGDMELNTSQQPVTLTDPVPPDGFDFASIVTHEAGHFLGLAHSGEARATMHATYTPGNTSMRYLTWDDVAGICAIYAAGEMRVVPGDASAPGPQCDPTPRRGFSSSCAEEPPKKSCWGSARIAASTPLSPGWLGLLIGSAMLLGIRIRRRRGRVRSSCRSGRRRAL